MIIELSNEDINSYINNHFGIKMWISNTSRNRIRLTYNGGAKLLHIPIDIDIKYHSKVQIELTPHCSLPGIETIISGALQFVQYRKLLPIGVVISGNSFIVTLNQIPQLSSLLSNVIINKIEFDSNGLLADVCIR